MSYAVSGATTTAEALWMGVPVVSMFMPRGFGGASRSVLSVVGLPELVARDVSEYIQIAQRLALDRDRLKTLR